MVLLTLISTIVNKPKFQTKISFERGKNWVSLCGRQEDQALAYTFLGYFIII